MKTGKPWDEIDLAFQNLQRLKCTDLTGSPSKNKYDGVLKQIIDHFEQAAHYQDPATVKRTLPDSLMTVDVTLTGRELLRSLEL